MNVSLSASAAVSPSPSEKERERLGSVALDQWRGLALVLVLISHGFYLTGRVHGLGRVGVNLFFFISGILVYRSLSRSRETSGGKRTVSFWWRRFRRLYPAMIFYALAMFIGTWLLQDRPMVPPYSDLTNYLETLPLVFGYAINYFTAHAPMALRHLWSVACEMQFYFLAPLIFLLPGNSQKKRFVLFGSLLVLLMASGIAQPLFRKLQDRQYNFEFAVWPMMLGFCCEFSREWFRKIPDRFVTLALWLSVVVCGGTLALTLVGLEMKFLVIAVGALLLAPCLLAYLFGRAIPGPAGSVMKWLGERTYSIYLWQQPFTIALFLPPALHPVGALVSIAVGAVWFHWFERPFLSASRRGDAARTGGQWSVRLKWIGAAVLIVGVVVPVYSLRLRYENSLRRLLWPSDVPQATEPPVARTDPTPTVLLMGDSRMAEWGVPDLGRWRVLNAGAPGWTTGQIRQQTRNLLAQFQPDTVVLQAGINDLKFLGVRPALEDSVVALAHSNLVAIVNECVEHRCKVIVLEVWPSGQPTLVRRWIWNKAVASSTDQLNAQLRELNSPERGVWVVDLFQRAGVKPGPEPFRDILHFTTETYQQLTGALRKELDVALPADRRQ